jgi:hypothetical protein
VSSTDLPVAALSEKGKADQPPFILPKSHKIDSHQSNLFSLHLKFEMIGFIVFFTEK